MQSTLICLDLEGVLIPEIWVALAEQTGIDALRATTRDIPDYDELMQQRLRVTAEHGLTMSRIQAVIATLSPLPGAVDFLADLRARYQVVILSDTYYEFAQPLMRQLAWPTLLCHRLVVDEHDMIVRYVLRQPDPKYQAVKALQSLNYKVIAAGDSFNDVSMLKAAETGIFFSAPESIAQQFPQFATTQNYAQLFTAITAADSSE